MSSANPIASPLQAGRRSHARRRIDGLTYVEFGPDNGAILIDLSEGGLGFQSVMPVSMNQALLFKFKLPWLCCLQRRGKSGQQNIGRLPKGRDLAVECERQLESQ
jgi:hypothetical protein